MSPAWTWTASVLLVLATIEAQAASGQHDRRTHITDFRYSSCRIDAITKLANDSLLVVSNGFYWLLDDGQLPYSYNVKGQVSQLYPGFKHVDTIWTDPYNDISEQIYLATMVSH